MNQNIIYLITSKKIKNKKELYTLTDKENEILKKTIELNKIGVYNNLRVVSKNGIYYLNV